MLTCGQCGMLTHISIDACQGILRKQFSVRSGLRDTILDQKLVFKEENVEFGQILHRGISQSISVTNFCLDFLVM